MLQMLTIVHAALTLAGDGKGPLVKKEVKERKGVSSRKEPDCWWRRWEGKGDGRAQLRLKATCLTIMRRAKYRLLG